jgi:PadR family transcriptional regulator
VPTELPFKRGAIELLILKTVSWRPMHGYAIAQWIQETTDDALKVEEGSLYPALHRLEQQGWIAATWQETNTGRSAKVYSLTRAGKGRLNEELQSWARLSSAINLVVDAV